MKESAQKILVTGGTGMLGAHLLWHLLKDGAKVRAIKRENSSLTQIEFVFKFYDDSLDKYTKQLEWVEGDVLDYDSLERAMENVKTVYHCAAIVSFSTKPRRLLDINIRGTQNIVYAVIKKDVGKLCFVSSIGALGKAEGGQLIDEETPWNSSENHSIYSESKYLSEQVVWQAMKKGLNAVIINPGVILGVAEENNNSMKLFSSIQRGLPFYTKGGSGYVSVQDVCKAMILLTSKRKKAQSYVLVSENLSNKEILSIIAKSFNKRPPFIKGTRFILMPIAFILELFGKLLRTKALIDRGTVRVVLDQSYYSSEKIKKALGFEFMPIKDCVDGVSNFLKKT